MGRTSLIPALEAKVGKDLYSYLIEALKQGKKQPEIALELGISLSQVYSLINKYELKDKFKEASQVKIVSGELKDLVDRYLEAKQNADLSQKTITNYRDGLGKLLWWLNETGQPASLNTFKNPATIEAFLGYLRTETVRFGGKASTSRRAMKSSSRRFYRMVLRAFGYWLMRQDFLEKNPVIKTEPIRVEKRLPEDIPDEILERIFDSFDDSFLGIRNKMLITLFCDTGLRLDGVVNLKSDQIDLSTGWGKVIEKGDKERLFRLSPVALDQLQVYIKVREPLAKTKLLWITEEGSPWKRDPIRAFVATLNKYSTAEHRIHPHAFRHVWAKHLALSDINPLKATVMGGWSDVELYMHYASAYTSDQAWEGAAQASVITKLLGKKKE